MGFSENAIRKQKQAITDQQMLEFRFTLRSLFRGEKNGHLQFQIIRSEVCAQDNLKRLALLYAHTHTLTTHTDRHTRNLWISLIYICVCFCVGVCESVCVTEYVSVCVCVCVNVPDTEISPVIKLQNCAHHQVIKR